jgi:signal transduction histidine kinase
LNNVAKHAEASEIALSLRVEHANLRLVIQDNGTGFDTNQLYFEMANRWGLGLKSMLERVESTGGVLLIQSGLNGGTTVDAHWALQAVVSDLLRQSSCG